MYRKAAMVVLLLLGAPCAFAVPLSGTDTAAALAALSHASDDGLDPVRYRVNDGRDADALKAALLSYMRDMAAGRADLRALDRDVGLPDSQFDAEAALGQAGGNLGSVLAGLAPPYPGYARLKTALARYRAIAARGGWPILDSHYDEAQLGARLDLEDGARASDTVTALKQFQARHGLAPDGVLGPMTLAALNVPAEARADTIAANMERWRWLPREMEADRIVINVADARLEMFLGGESVLTSRVIVGRPRDPTPILRAEGAGVTINPSWTVPTSIAAREILPKLKRNPAYLASQDMVLLDGPPGDPEGRQVNWRAIRAGTFPYRIRQRPGAKNPLGRIKIELPNQFDVYLHDTPGKSAFRAASRDLSHGCVRVEQIMPLATYALAADPSAMEKISDAIDAGNTTYLPLGKKLPVYFLYWTAFADEDGAMEFRPDIYGRDSRMIAARQMQHLALNPEKCSHG